jgi:hypothetical protein
MAMKFHITFRRRDHKNPLGKRQIEDYIFYDSIDAFDIVAAAEFAEREAKRREGDVIVSRIERVW